MNNQLGARLVFENAKVALGAAGLTEVEIENAVLSQSYLRFEQPLTAGQSSFTFPILNNQTTSGNPIRNTEQRLNLQDAFYVAEIAFFVAKCSSATDSAYSPDTYPNPVTFPLGGAVPSAPYNVLWNGKLVLSINNSVIIPAMDMLRFKQIPRTQLTAATNSPLDEFDGANDRSAFVVVEPNIVFIGSKNTQLSVVLPGSVASGALDANTYLIIEVRGILAQNVTVVT